MKSELGHLAFALLALVIGTAILAVVMPVVAAALFVLGLLCFALWFMVRPSPPGDDQ